MRIVFMGTPQFALPTLAGIIAAGHPDRRGLRNRHGRPAAAWQKEITRSPLGRPTRLAGGDAEGLKGEPEQQAFAVHGADVAVVVAYGLILPKPVLAAPRHGCLNLPCRAGAVPLPFSARSWRATGRRRLPSCAWMRGSTPGRSAARSACPSDRT